MRLLIHCLADGGMRMGAGTVAFDYETSHGIVRNLRSIGTLYNQSVAALEAEQRGHVTLVELVVIESARRGTPSVIFLACGKECDNPVLLPPPDS